MSRITDLAEFFEGDDGSISPPITESDNALVAKALRLLDRYDHRVAELIEATNREVERRREAEEEIEFWRQEMAAKLEMLMALAKVAEAKGLSSLAVDRQVEINLILNAFRDADAKEWHTRCVECGEFITPGTLTILVGDEDGGEPAHASCFGQTEGTPEAPIDVAGVVRRAREFMQSDRE